MSKLLVTLATLCPLVLVAVPAAAAVRDFDAKSVAVSYAGLDLTQPAGRAELDRRIANGVKAVCDSTESSPLALRSEIRKCRAFAWQNANARRQAVVTAAIADRGAELASR